MLLFRSEEHVARWLAERRLPVGAVFPLSQGWTLARLWFADWRSVHWRRRGADEAHEVFARAGLTGPFWRLA